MDGPRFDTLTRLLTGGRSRRGLGPLLGALVAGGLSLPAAPDTEAKRRKKRKKKKKGNRGGKLPPPPPPRCPQAAAPNWCASANTCVPACPEGKVYEPTSCKCVCQARSCCYCGGGNSPFCSEVFATASDCFDSCLAINPNPGELSYSGGDDVTYTCASTGCDLRCSSDDCQGADACQGGANFCWGGACFQPLGGGPTRCGVSAGPASCGCTSHQQCADAHGIGAFCASVTGVGCGCPAGTGTTFCAIPSPNF